MSLEHSDAQGGKPRKRQSGKSAGRAGGGKVKSTIHLSVEASQRLDIHATMTNLDRSALVEQLINLHLRRWVVSDRGGSESPTDSTAA